MIQFRRELKATQKGVLEILGGGSEATVAKYLKQIKEELPEREIALFSPDLPIELVPVLESIYHRALEASEQALSSERIVANKVAEEALTSLELVKIKLAEEVENRQGIDVRLITQGHQLEALGNSYSEAKDALVNAQVEFERQKELATLGRLRQKSEHSAALLELQTEKNQSISDLKVQVATLEAKYSAENKQVVFERERSDAETARLYQEIDSLKEQQKSDKISADDSARRLEAELHLAHAREDKHALNSSNLDKALKEREDTILNLRGMLRSTELKLSDKLG